MNLTCVLLSIAGLHPFPTNADLVTSYSTFLKHTTQGFSLFFTWLNLIHTSTVSVSPNSFPAQGLSHAIAGSCPLSFSCLRLLLMFSGLRWNVPPLLRLEVPHILADTWNCQAVIFANLAWISISFFKAHFFYIGDYFGFVFHKWLFISFMSCLSLVVCYFLSDL